ncbi:MAG: hypothetical protein K6346_08620, partial [Halothiobacillaceae bacterium]
ARTIDPTPYLESRGYVVKREGRHLSVRQGEDEVYRLTRRPEGHWVWCDLYGNTGGDNIALVQELEPGTGYAEAVYRLIGGGMVTAAPSPEPKREPPKLPRQWRVPEEQGRAYLQNIRRISPETITHAERSGMLRYGDGAVLFVGYDRDGMTQNATRRAINPADHVQKRDLRGSDKRYPPILPGNTSEVWIVEGGTDALALHDLYRRVDKQPPTAIVSGGAGVLSFLDNPVVRGILKVARRIVVAFEREKDAETQARTDALHGKQMARIAEIVGREPERWSPPSGCKDLADLNAEAQMADISRRYDQRHDRMRLAAAEITWNSPQGEEPDEPSKKPTAPGMGM